MKWSEELFKAYQDTYTLARTYEADLAQAVLALTNAFRTHSGLGLNLKIGAIAPTAQQWQNAHDDKIAMDDSGGGRFLLTHDAVVSGSYGEALKALGVQAQVTIWRSEAGKWVARVGSGEGLPTDDVDGLCGQLLGLFKQQVTHAATHRL